MKKKLFLLASLFAITISNAQIKEKRAVEITPKIGYSSFSELTSVTNSNGSIITGIAGSNSRLSAGVTFDYYFNNRWSIRSGFSFDKMGSITNQNGIKFEDKLNYISIPVNANWHFGSTRKWNLNFGLSPSFLTNASFI